MKLLVVEDNERAARSLGRSLEQHGFTVEVATDGPAGLEAARRGGFDCLLLDVMLPGLDGFTLLEEVRTLGQDVPVIFLTARDALPDRIRGLQLGRGDYLVKPFAFTELLLRLNNLLYRTPPEEEQVYRVGDLTLFPFKRKVYRGGARIDLTPQEYSLLELLLRNAGHVVTRARIAEELWEMAWDGDSNLVDAAVRRLRRKVDEPFGSPIIQTRRGVGYVAESFRPA
jgi:two-component system copper resistance phosphate regulon response regulator CusR